jgi:acetyl esterase/lipase
LPATVIITSEYDIFRKEAYDFAEKLKKSSKLLDFCDYVSVGHEPAISLLTESIINDQLTEDLNAIV